MTIFSRRNLSIIISVAAVGAASASAETTSTNLGLGVISEPFLGQREFLGWSEQGVGRLSHFRETGQFGLGLVLSAEPDGEGLRIDGSYLERRFGNWALGVGAIERHWSPSAYSSLILSKNARPVPSVYLAKRTPSAFETPLLAWLGPWDGEIFVGATSSTAGEHNGIAGARVAIRPFEGFEAEFVRTAQWESGGLDTLFDALVGNTNSGTNAEVNQMAGLGLSYRLPPSIFPARFYLQGIGEDEAGGLPSCFMYLAGVEFEGALGGVPTTLTVEGIDTRIDETPNGFCGPGTAYNNSRHPYTNFGAVMGAPIDSESHALQFRVRHQLEGLEWIWGVGHYTINDASLANHRLSSTRVSGPMAHVGFSAQLGAAEVEAMVVYQDFELDRADSERGLRVGLNLAMSF